MENNQKPEWFELADNDQPAKRSAKPTKSALAVVATLALTTLAGWGFITNDEPLANASDLGTISQTSDLTPATGSAMSESTAPTGLQVTDASPSPTASTSNEIILPPSPKNGDDEEGNDDEHEDDD